VISSGRPNFGFGFSAEYREMSTFGGHSVSAESNCPAFGTLGFVMVRAVLFVVAKSKSDLEMTRPNTLSHILDPDACAPL